MDSSADGFMSFKAAKAVVLECLMAQLKTTPSLSNDTDQLKRNVRLLLRTYPRFSPKHIISAVTRKLVTQAKRQYTDSIQPTAPKAKRGSKRPKNLGLSPAQLTQSQKMNEAMARKQELRRKATAAEQRFAEVMKAAGIPCVSQAVIFTAKGYFIADFRVSAGPYKLLVEIDGGYHKDRKGYDEWRTQQIQSTKAYREFEVVRFTNEQVLSGEFVAKMKELRPRPFAKREQELRDGKIQSLPWVG